MLAQLARRAHAYHAYASSGPPPSPTVASSDLSLISVSGYWQPDEIQRFPAPFRVVHDSSCAQEPTLCLGLNTSLPSLSVDGSLTVAGVDVGAIPAADTASGRLIDDVINPWFQLITPINSP